MLRTIASLFASLHARTFAKQVEREINQQIAPHIHGEHDHGYPFKSPKELWKAAYHGSLDAQFDLETIEREADQMGKAYGDAFRYLMYRDVNQCLARYKQFMQERIRPESREPRLAAEAA